ncbi:Nascent polypeptide-associated complex subunit beta [Dimargaris verticillata]|uniref:Nascent polypeptide-associated complex subunit beta n=1 Tax=Dimargaris verticillata TaxID=2761393 RepID=A0A9W8B6T5_9FUNG|nr:Nascent polypeptide-associated complex subunit beta [Dimargaris verticillata]
MEMSNVNNLQSQVRMGGRGTPRRNFKRASNASNTVNDKKISSVLKKLNVQPLSNVEQVNMFREDQKVLHFQRPKVQASVNANTFVVSGKGQVKELAELIPGIITQMGPESLATLQKFAEAYEKAQKANAEGGEEEDIPDLVGDFDEVAEKEEEEVKEEEAKEE